MKECVARAGRMHRTVFPLALRPKLPARKSGCAQLRGGVVVDGSFDANPHRHAVSTMFLTGSSAKGSTPKMQRSGEAMHGESHVAKSSTIPPPPCTGIVV